MKDDPEKPEYKVGYGKPPKDKQYTKGQSGNPSGRRRGSKSFRTLLEEELQEMITVTVNGKKKRITKAKAIVKHAIHLTLTKNDPRLLTAMGAFKEDAASKAFPNGFPEDFTLTFENEPRQRCVNGEWIRIPQPGEDDPS